MELTCRPHSGMMPPSPAPPIYTSAQSEDGNWAYSTCGSNHLILTSAPGMYKHNNNQASSAPHGAPSTASNASLESDMTKISKTMLELAQAYQEIVNTQQQNHQTMVNVQQQWAQSFGALAAITQQEKYDVMFAAVPKYDGKNKEECAVWINQISSLAASAGRKLRLELLNRSEGDVMTIIAEEIMKCFSNASTTIWAIGLLRGIQQTKMSKFVYMQLDMNLSTIGQIISCLRSRLKSMRWYTMHEHYYLTFKRRCWRS